MLVCEALPDPSERAVQATGQDKLPTDHGQRGLFGVQHTQGTNPNHTTVGAEGTQTPITAGFLTEALVVSLSFHK